MPDSSTRAPVRRPPGGPGGIVARAIAEHPLLDASTVVSFDHMAQNQLLGTTVHRGSSVHDETGDAAESVVVVLSGRGRTTFEGPDGPGQLAWTNGDLLAIPAGIPHRHHLEDASTLLVLDDRPLLRRMFATPGARGDVLPDGVALAPPSCHRSLAALDLEPAPDIGRSAAVRRLDLPGIRRLSVSLVELGHRGHVRRHRHLVEEAALVLHGRGRTTIGSADGREVTTRWHAGDLVQPPLGQWHQHVSEAKSHLTTRLLVVRHRAVEVALGTDEALETRIVRRMPDLIEPPRAARVDRGGPDRGGPA